MFGFCDLSSFLAYGVGSDVCKEDSEVEKTNEKEETHSTVRGDDIKLIQFLKVGTIVDLMVENKKVKFGFK